MDNKANKDLLLSFGEDKFIAVYENENSFYYLGEFSDANKAHKLVHKLGLSNANTIMRYNPDVEYDFELIVGFLKEGKKRVFVLQETQDIDTSISVNKLEEEIMVLEKLLDNKDMPFENKEVVKDEIDEKKKLLNSLKERIGEELVLENIHPSKKITGKLI
jgi:hypothetical protein